MKRHSNLRIYTNEATERIRSYRSRSPQRAPLSDDDALLAEARLRVQRRMWLRKNLPVTLLLSIPGLFYLTTRSSGILLIFVFASPLLLAIRTILLRLLASRLGDEEALVRQEYHRLSASRRPPDADS